VGWLSSAGLATSQAFVDRLGNSGGRRGGGSRVAAEAKAKAVFTSFESDEQAKVGLTQQMVNARMTEWTAKGPNGKCLLKPDAVIEQQKDELAAAQVGIDTDTDEE
jgi:hypothetical protein